MIKLLKLAPSTKFKKDLKRISRQGKDRMLLDDIILKLQRKEALPQKNIDHSLIGKYKGYKECHITPDWLLIYLNAPKDLFLKEEVFRRVKINYLTRSVNVFVTM